MDRTRFVFRETDDVVAQVAVKLLAHPVQPVRGDSSHKGVASRAFVPLQRHFTAVERFRLQIATAIGFGEREGDGCRSSPDAHPRRRRAFR